jgi:hypothetical protein
MKLVAKMLNAIHAQESKAAAKEKTKQVAADLRNMKHLENTLADSDSAVI